MDNIHPLVLFSFEVKLERVIMKIRKYQISEMAGISPAMLSEILHGNVRPSLGLSENLWCRMFQQDVSAECFIWSLKLTRASTT